jgi:two-component system, chemotaxis family, CheB/CheR fusion protein
LPGDTGLAFVYVQHLDPSHPSMLTALLSRSSTVPVLEATDSMALEPDHVYVIPPNTYLSLADGVLRLTPRPVKRGVPMPIDYFLCSLAEHRASQAIGVVPFSTSPLA